MGQIDKAIKKLKERGGDDAMRQLNELEYHGSVGDDEPLIDEDADPDDDPEVDPEDDRLPSERFYNPRGL